MEATAGTSCSKCLTPKREANHWFVIVTNASGWYGQPFEEFDCAQPDEAVHVVCGESCAVKVISSWFAGSGRPTIEETI